MTAHQTSAGNAPAPAAHVGTERRGSAHPTPPAPPRTSPATGGAGAEPLRVQIHRHLTEHPDLTAHEIARVLGRSSGGVRAALQRMEADGEATRSTGIRYAGDTRSAARWRAT